MFPTMRLMPFTREISFLSCMLSLGFERAAGPSGWPFSFLDSASLSILSTGESGAALRQKGSSLALSNLTESRKTSYIRDWHDNVHDNVNMFGLGGIDLLCFCFCCSRASTETGYCQYIHNMLLWACKKYCCCTYNIYEITPI